MLRKVCRIERVVMKFEFAKLPLMKVKMVYASFAIQAALKSSTVAKEMIMALVFSLILVHIQTMTCPPSDLRRATVTWYFPHSPS
jgi:hypothetical protein